MGFHVNKPKSGTKSKIPQKRMEQIEQYIDEMYDNTKQFARELNELPTTSENNQDNIMLQDIINIWFSFYHFYLFRLDIEIDP